MPGSLLFSVDHFKMMQSAVDATRHSSHPDPQSRVGCTVVGFDSEGRAIHATRPNFRPEILRQHFDPDGKIGDSSTYVHAEIAAIFEMMKQGGKLEGGIQYATDAHCPNCKKHSVEAGIVKFYVDDKAFTTKGYFKERGIFYEKMSLSIASYASAEVFRLARDKAERSVKITRMILPESTNRPWPCRSPVTKTTYNGEKNSFSSLIEQDRKNYGGEAFAACLTTHLGETFFLSAKEGLTCGIPEEPESLGNKYSWEQMPLGRLFMGAARHGHKIKPGTIYSSRVPTSREWVDFIGLAETLGFQRIEIIIGNTHKARDDQSLQAMSVLLEKGIVTLTPLSDTTLTL